MFTDPLPTVPYASVPPLAWPEWQAGQVQRVTLDLAAYLPGTAIESVSLTIAPSGSGELQATDMSAVGTMLTVEFSGGVAGREYVTEITVTAPYAQTIVVPASLYVSPVLASWPPSDPPSWDFGPPITWTSGATTFGPAIAAVQTGLVGTGTNQATALPLPAQTNIIASVPSGTGFILNGAIVSGTIVVQDDDPTNTAPIYPPVGAQINSLGVNVPFIVGSQGARISFSTQNAATQWYAG